MPFKTGGSLSKVAVLAGLCVSILCGGCVIHKSDAASGTETLWGFGYMKVRVSPANEDVRLRATEVNLIGLDLEAGPQSYGLNLGYNRQQQISVTTNAAVSIEWGSGGLFGAQAGTNFPSQLTPHSHQTLIVPHD